MLFHSYIEKKKKSCRTENNNCLAGDLQEHHDLTYLDSCKSKGFWHQEVCNNQPCPSFTLPLKMLYWNPLGSLGFEGYEPPILPAWPCNKPFSAPNSDVLVLLVFSIWFGFGLNVCWAHELAFGNTTKWYMHQVFLNILVHTYITMYSNKHTYHY